ncbi:MAG: hypothetical protein XD74_0991 [Actinobacteria bacterium 66_15]|nr:MAG: hypothetical protein XD74_0991 [Actinobacteria bacterium 66_15]
MENSKLSRRQFLGGTAAVAAASVLPAVTSAAPAVATPVTTFPDTSIQGASWIPLDPAALARKGYEIYKGIAGGGQGG